MTVAVSCTLFFMTHLLLYAIMYYNNIIVSTFHVRYWIYLQNIYCDTGVDSSCVFAHTSSRSSFSSMEKHLLPPAQAGQ